MKKMISALLALLCITSMILPTAAAGITKAPRKTVAWLGWEDSEPIDIAADGSFLLDSEEISFGFSSPNAVCTRQSYYPYTIHTWASGDLAYALQLFMDPIGEDTENLAVYARLTVENSGAEAVAFPVPCETLLPLTSVPSQISADGAAVCDYALLTKTSEEELSAELFGTFEEHLEHMRAFWNKRLSSAFQITALPEDSILSDTLATAYVDQLLGVSDAPGAYLTYLKQTPAEALPLTCYDAAIYLMKTGDTESILARWAELEQTYKGYCDHIQQGRTADGETVHLILDAGSQTDASLTENLTALAEIKAFAYLCRYPGLPESSEPQTVYDALLSSVEAVMRNTIALTEKSFSGHWSAVGCSQGSYNSTVLYYTPEECSSVLIDWYGKDSIFRSSGGTYLKGLVRVLLPYVRETDLAENPQLLANMLVCQREDGTVSIGAGIPVGELADGATLSFRNYPLAGGSQMDFSLNASGDTLTIRLSLSTDSVSLEFPALRDNIAFASCGFDSENGIVSIPAGTTDVTIRLETPAKELAAFYSSRRMLEEEIAAADNLSISDVTNYSRELYAEALEAARSARTGPAAEMRAAAIDLREARSNLAPLRSYTNIFLYNENSACIGTVQGKQIFQSFTPAATGTLSALSVVGAYQEDATASLYTLLSDGRTVGKLLETAECFATENGLGVSFSTEVSQGEQYLVCISAKTELSLEYFSALSESGILYAVGTDDDFTVENGVLGCQIELTQANLDELDDYVQKCMNADISGYTKESRNRLEKALMQAQLLLCSNSVTISEHNTVFAELKATYNALATYPSDHTVEKTPPALYVVLAITVVLLVVGGVGAFASYKKQR